MPGEMAYAAHSWEMPMYRATHTWAGFSGAPGYTTLYFLDPDPISESGINQTALRVHNFWAAIGPYLPIGVSISMPTVLEEVTSDDGELVAEHTWPGGTTVNGAAGNTYSSAVGACITWNSIGIVNGRRLRGRTFLVPLGSQVFAADGTLSDSIRGSIQTAGNTLANADALAGGIDLAVWHRPTAGLSDGSAAGVVNCTVRDKTAVLRSRRD